MSVILRCTLLLFTAIWFTDSRADQDKLVFAINAPGSAPYLYFDEKSRAYRGIVVDFFASYEGNTGFMVKYLDSSRARNEVLVMQGKADLFLSSPQWLINPDKLIFSETLLSHKSFLYQLNPFPEKASVENLPKSLICTRRGYVYPSLSNLFEQRMLTRVDSGSQITMANMLIKGRCDYAVMNEFNAKAELYKQQFCQQAFYRSPKHIDDVPLQFAISPAQRANIDKINRQLRLFVENGGLAASIEKHVGIKPFPKPASC